MASESDDWMDESHGGEETMEEQTHDFGMLVNTEERSECLDEYLDIVQKTFQSEEACYDFYNSYAKRKGFSVRKDTLRHERKVGDVYFRQYVCSKQGVRDPKWIDRKDRKRKQRPETREECTARISFRLDKQNGVWFVDNFVDEHDHPLTSPDETAYLRSHRKIKNHQKEEIMLIESRGIRKHVIMDSFVCKSGGYDRVGFVDKDLYNLSSRVNKSIVERGDANAALKIMKERHEKDPDFFYDYQLDAEGRLKTLFWCDSQSRMDYQAFGDVVVFDSTYRMNKYKMPFVPFVGLNHHRQTTVFACGIVSDEGQETYCWLLRTFLRAMCQQKPKSIITDGDQAMIKAIRKVMPETNHRLCSWHIEKNMKKHLHNSCIDEFRKFIYHACHPADFDAHWNKFVAEYESTDNQEWLKRMYNKRRLWAAAFLRDKYFMGMQTNQRSESLNSSLHKHLDGYMTLVRLIQHYEVCVSDMRRREAGQDSRASQSWHVPVTDNRQLEEAAGHVFTEANFNLLQEEIHKVNIFDVAEVVKDANCLRFRLVTRRANKRSKDVEYISSGLDSTMKCRCRKMEREGIPCRHIFCVLKHLEMVEIPDCCVLLRLSKNAKCGLPSNRRSDLHVWSQKQDRYHELSALGFQLFDLASTSEDGFAEVKEYLLREISKQKSLSRPSNVGEKEPEHMPEVSALDPIIVVTKGAPRQRFKSFDERRERLCGRCRLPGHDIRNCSVVAQEKSNHVGEASAA